VNRLSGSKLPLHSDPYALLPPAKTKYRAVLQGPDMPPNPRVAALTGFEYEMSGLVAESHGNSLRFRFRFRPRPRHRGQYLANASLGVTRPATVASTPPWQPVQTVAADVSRRTHPVKKPLNRCRRLEDSAQSSVL
jgi:hypothetical protein